jgi:hypothetical protein
MTGCASGQLFIKEQLPHLSAVDEGRVFVYRKAAGGFGSGIRPDISVDGQIIGRAVSGGYFFVDLPEGRHIIQVEQKMFSPEVAFDLKPGEEKYIKLRIVPGVFKGHISPILVDNTTGESEIRNTKSL